MMKKQDYPLLLAFFGVGGAFFIIIGHLTHNEFLRIGGIVFMITCITIGSYFLFKQKNVNTLSQGSNQENKN